MSNLINFDEQKLIEGWLEQERQGVKFPADFELAWQIAGYSKKSNGKRKLLDQEYFVEGEDFLICEHRTPHKDSSAYSTREAIKMTCDAFKEFCMLAKKEKGKAARKFFIAREKELSIIEKSNPAIAIEAEAIRLQIELKQAEKDLELAKAQSNASELVLLEKKENIVRLCPEPIQQKLLGYQVVEKVEYRDRTFVEEDLINDGSTVTKAFLCDRYGFKSKSGSPSYAVLNKFLSQIGADKDEHLWDNTMTVRTNKQFKREHLDLLDRAFQSCSRQLFLGE